MQNITLLAHISREQDFRCIYCNIRMRFPRITHATKPTTVTKEHKIPRCIKGSDDEENIAAACSRCNVMRGHLDPDLFRTILNKLFQVAFIRMNWHTTEPNACRFIRKIFRYEIDAILAFEDREAAIRAVTRRHKYSLDELTAATVPLEDRIPIVH